MGRYYSGDIEGKFWFAVQSSNAADRFGVEGTMPNCLEYFFDEGDLEGVVQEIDNIVNKIGEENLKKLEVFFNSVNGYNDQIMKDAGVLELWEIHKEDFADLLLGRQIAQCIRDNGFCSFTAEL